MGFAIDNGEPLEPSPVIVASVDTVDRPPVPEPVPAPMAVLTAVFSVSVKSFGGFENARSPIDESDKDSCASMWSRTSAFEHRLNHQVNSEKRFHQSHFHPADMSLQNGFSSGR